MQLAELSAVSCLRSIENKRDSGSFYRRGSSITTSLAGSLGSTPLHTSLPNSSGSYPAFQSPVSVDPYAADLYTGGQSVSQKLFLRKRRKHPN